jgi:hypothetical protein
VHECANAVKNRLEREYMDALGPIKFAQLKNALGILVKGR